MAWKDKIGGGGGGLFSSSSYRGPTMAAYTSSRGTRIEFDYENVSMSFDKKTTAFDFPDADGTFIQDLGTSGRKFPLRCFFSGSDCDEAGDIFTEILSETGAGKLQHPMYGTITVVPYGAITRRDDLKTAANQTVFDVTFWETTNVIYPTNQADGASLVTGAIDSLNEAMGGHLENSAELGTVAEQNGFAATVSSLMDTAKEGLDVVADTTAAVEQQFNAIYDSIDTAIDVLVEQPITLASQIMALVQSPARAFAAISTRLSVYRRMAENILGIDDDDPDSEINVYTAGYNSTNANKFYADEVFAVAAVSGQVLSVVNTTFETQVEAQEAAEGILELFSEVVVWRDANYESLGEIDTGEVYQQLQEAVAICAGYLLEISFSLKQERKIVLTRDRSFIDVCAELYGQTDEIYDFFIKTNDLSGDEYFELKKGRTVVYYI